MRLNGISHPDPPQHIGSPPDPEVPPSPLRKAKRRQLTTSYKLQVLKETDNLDDGQVGAYLRKNALYWSYLSSWRALRESGGLSEQVSGSRGRKKAQPADSADKDLAAARKQIESLQEKLDRANLVL